MGCIKILLVEKMGVCGVSCYPIRKCAVFKKKMWRKRDET
jgi:hypothetical protein